MLDETLQKYLSNKNKNKNNYNFSKYIIWVFRIPNNLELKKRKISRDAMPCNSCCLGLKKLGFRKICFSDKNGNTQVIDLRYFINNHISAAQKHTFKYSKK